MPNAADEIRARTEAFVASLAVLIKQAALEAASAALGGGHTTPAPAAKRGRGRPRKAPAAKAPAAKAPVAKAPVAKAKSAKAAPRKPVKKGSTPRTPVKKGGTKRAPGAKRPAAELAKLIEGLGAYIKAHPGIRMEGLSKALGAPAKDLRFPVVKLVRAKKVRTEGQKQNMAYFPV